MPGPNQLGKLHCVAGSLHVDTHLTALISGQIIDSRQVVDMVYAIFELGNVSD